ncbi:hypothetical protein PAD3_1872 [Pediococcus acidilactici D3]|nr:hypothetical protein PAD3_1872 [Pediococcus acidilactici D3]
MHAKAPRSILFGQGAFLVQKNYPLTNISEGKTGWAD